MVAGAFRFGRIEKGTICLTLNNPSLNGDGRCSLPESKPPCRWRNWKVTCETKSSGRRNRDGAKPRLSSLPFKQSDRRTRSKRNSRKLKEQRKSASGKKATSGRGRFWVCCS